MTIDQGQSFEGEEFEGGATFDGVTFPSGVSFKDVTFKGPASFDRCRFEGSVSFDSATFEGDAIFTGATFCKQAWFSGARFLRDANFGEAIFEGAAFGRARGFSVVGQLDFGQALFKRPLDLVIAAELIYCVGTSFEAGGNWKIRWAEIDLRRAIISEVLIVAAGREVGTSDPEELVQLCKGEAEAVARGLDADEVSRRSTRTARPRLLTLEGTNVENLVLEGLDLRACRFHGAHKLDQLQISDAEFPSTPGWTGRAAIWEEHRWRSTRGPPPLRKRWYGDANRQRPSAATAIPAYKPAQIASVYRALRKGREAAKDEPGAADLYFGEMEMRRHSGGEGGFGTRLASWWEQRTIWLYWLLSGYALRPLRAFVALVIVVAAGAVALHQYGFRDLDQPFAPATASAAPTRPPPYELPGSAHELGDALADQDGLVYSASTAVALAPSPDARLTRTGRGIRTAIRVLGPIMLGLMLLSIRGRVKR
ncbi:MAG: hypothetical protein QOI73_1392 [Solirubrobacteraceae bacterium]|nr:hypothetical protein [Solirubrobacteraceae bacterium]